MGPAAIESDADVAASVGPLVDTAARFRPDAYVVACFSDPGLAELRSACDVPVFGIAESAIQRALQLGKWVGVVSSVEESPPRHERYWRSLGVEDSIVADVAVGLGVLELNTDEAYDRTERVAKQLVATGADVVVLGCTGMTHMQARLEETLGIPVIDPCRAAVDAAYEEVGGTAP